MNTENPHVQRFVVARTSDVPLGGRLIVEVDGREVGIYNIDGEFYALLNRCPHRAGPLCEGDAISFVSSPAVGEISLDKSRTMVTCPWHAWEFDVRTGQSYWDPAKTRFRRVPVEVEAGPAVAAEIEQSSAELVPGPYMAEVIPTSTEEDYVVVAMRRRPPSESDAAP